MVCVCVCVVCVCMSSVRVVCVCGQVCVHECMVCVCAYMLCEIESKNLPIIAVGCLGEKIISLPEKRVHGCVLK